MNEQPNTLLAEMLAETLELVNEGITLRARDLVDAKVIEIDRISGGLVTTTPEQAEALCDLECVRLRSEFAEQVSSLAQAYMAAL